MVNQTSKGYIGPLANLITAGIAFSEGCKNIQNSQLFTVWHDVVRCNIMEFLEIQEPHVGDSAEASLTSTIGANILSRETPPRGNSPISTFDDISPVPFAVETPQQGETASRTQLHRQPPRPKRTVGTLLQRREGDPTINKTTLFWGAFQIACSVVGAISAWNQYRKYYH